jgi:hypothetical protein
VEALPDAYELEWPLYLYLALELAPDHGLHCDHELVDRLHDGGSQALVLTTGEAEAYYAGHQPEQHGAGVNRAIEPAGLHKRTLDSVSEGAVGRALTIEQHLALAQELEASVFLESAGESPGGPLSPFGLAVLARGYELGKTALVPEKEEQPTVLSVGLHKPTAVRTEKAGRARQQEAPYAGLLVEHAGVAALDGVARREVALDPRVDDCRRDREGENRDRQRYQDQREDELERARQLLGQGRPCTLPDAARRFQRGP